MRRRRAAIAAVTLAVIVMLGAGIAPASAATDSVLLSRDGIHYSTSLSGGLFDGAAALIPGHSVSTELWIKNPTAAPASVRVSVQGVNASSPAFATGVALSTASSLVAAKASAEPLVDVRRCDVLTSVPRLAPGAVMQIALTFTMDDMVGTVAQTDSVGLDLLVALRDAQAGPFAASACDDDGVVVASNSKQLGTIAYTGTELPVPLIIAAGPMLGVGIFLVGRRRRRADDGHH
ncbi:hypothetical protein [Glaciihabitans sp. UYNi722]|uniref:hypothetical protein n=1 Tax=Glaciihabitans sp. UYNi722 TaxID=3156344 RepID=UPI003392C314